MPIFVVMADADTPELQAKIEAVFPHDFISVADRQWLVSADVTAQELSDRLDITHGAMGRVFIGALSSYYGRHSTHIWEWIRIKWEGGPHGR